MDMNNNVLEIKRLISEFNCMGTYGLVELELTEIEKKFKLVNQALNASVKAIYFNDRSDYLSFHFEVVRNLTGIDEPSEEDIKKLFKELNPDCI